LSQACSRYHLVAACAALVLGGVAVAQASTSDGPALDERIRCQEALERVYWSHRSPSSNRSFAQAVPRDLLRRRAEDAVLKGAELQRLWRLEITPEQLQAELDRMAARSRAPGRLRELFAALGDDPRLAAECLARPLLADRLLRASYARDQRLHEDVRERARREATGLATAGVPRAATGVTTEVEWRRGRDGEQRPGALELEPREFEARTRNLRAELGGPEGEIVAGRPGPLREDESRFYVHVVREIDDRHVRMTLVEWPKRPFDEWWQEVRAGLTAAPLGAGFEYRLPALGPSACPDDSWAPTLQLLDPRYWHTAVWTGSEMIVFGGMEAVGNIFGDGSRYDPATDTWTLLPSAGAPGPRQSHVAVWTGTEMVVWGGRGDSSGGRYDPATNTWTPTATAGAPEGRVNASVVWTGTEMIVWGGEGNLGVANSGGRYDPASDTWTAMAPAPLAPRAYHSAVWTGSQMIVWGGYNVHIGQLYGDGARYSPASNSWTPVAAAGAPDARTYHTAVWTGDEMIVWGGVNEPAYDQSGGRYDPVADAWTPTSLVNAPSLRWFHAAVWTGSEMIVQGGSFGVVAGGRYDPASDTWTATSPVNSANNGQGITAVWTGTEMIVWGGLDDDFYFHNDGGRYDPATDLWHPTGTMNVPAARGLHSAEWTGSEMIIWGGFSSGVSRPGGRYDPATDSWRTVTTVGAPYGRENATSVWTGDEAIFWGGEPDGLDLGSGGRYDPATDSWTLTSMVNAPANRYGHTAVWTGSEMIVFGGIGTFTTDSVAKRYRPATDTWTNATLVNAPGSRDHHTAVWTGTEMIVWGGFINDGITPTGGRYDPATDHWTPTNVADSPVTRMWPIGVWTGTEMVVWGGYDWLFVGDLGDGARYPPATDAWTPTTLAGAPTPRSSQGVWTGSELVLWGGANDPSGGRYDPASDSWRPTTLVGAPAVRPGGRWSTVWTGTEMIIWGGANNTQQGSRYCAAPSNGLFSDGFESGGTSAWSVTVP
jgi:N-acetylneuraminic acid mutarotase